MGDPAPALRCARCQEEVALKDSPLIRLISPDRSCEKCQKVWRILRQFEDEGTEDERREAERHIRELQSLPDSALPGEGKALRVLLDGGPI